MTPAEVPESFERQMGCTADELVAALPVALAGAALRLDRDQGEVEADFAGRVLHIAWTVMPPRTIALLSVPVLGVRFQYHGFDAAQRHTVQRRFDLATQRGGG